MITGTDPRKRLPSVNRTEPAVTVFPPTVTVAVNVNTVPMAPVVMSEAGSWWLGWGRRQ